MKRWVKWTLGVAAIAGAVYVLVGVDVRPHVEYVADPAPVDSVPLPLPPPDAYGIPMSGYVLREGVVKSGATFGDLLAEQGVAMTVVNALVERSHGMFDVRKLRAGYPYAFIFPESGSGAPTYFVYEPDPIEYVVFNLRQDSLAVTFGQRPVGTPHAPQDVLHTPSNVGESWTESGVYLINHNRPHGREIDRSLRDPARRGYAFLLAGVIGQGRIITRP